MIDHLSLQVTDLAQSVLGVCDRALRTTSERYKEGGAVGLGDEEHTSLWILPAERTGRRELHFAFAAASRDVVGQFRDAACAMETGIAHEPRLFPEYGRAFFGCFVRGPDGHRVEAVCRLEE